MSKSQPKPQMYSGFHAVESLLTHRPEAVLDISVQISRAEREDPRLDALVALANQHGIAVQQARREVLEKHAGPQHQGVVARARPRRPGNEQQLLGLLDVHSGPCTLLILEGVTDPHNLGACLRSADAAGVTAVIVPGRNAAGLTPVVCRTAAGAAESLPYFEIGNLATLLDKLRAQGIWVMGTALQERSENLFSITPPPEKLAIVMGAEGAGLKRLTRDKCDQLIAIPMAGTVQSLNVSVATAVMLFHMLSLRQ